MSLNSNTTGLEEILASVNALPEAGGGGGDSNVLTGTITPTEDMKGLLPWSLFGSDTEPDDINLIYIGWQAGTQPTVTNAIQHGAYIEGFNSRAVTGYYNGSSVSANNTYPSYNSVGVNVGGMLYYLIAGATYKYIIG